jgi:hypothetical protein
LGQTRVVAGSRKLPELRSCIIRNQNNKDEKRKPCNKPDLQKPTNDPFALCIPLNDCGTKKETIIISKHTKKAERR